MTYLIPYGFLFFSNSSYIWSISLARINLVSLIILFLEQNYNISSVSLIPPISDPAILFLLNINGNYEILIGSVTNPNYTNVPFLFNKLIYRLLSVFTLTVLIIKSIDI